MGEVIEGKVYTVTLTIPQVFLLQRVVKGEKTSYSLLPLKRRESTYLGSLKRLYIPRVGNEDKGSRLLLHSNEKTKSTGTF